MLAGAFYFFHMTLLITTNMIAKKTVTIVSGTATVIMSPTKYSHRVCLGHNPIVEPFSEKEVLAIIFIIYPIAEKTCRKAIGVFGY